MRTRGTADRRLAAEYASGSAPAGLLLRACSMRVLAFGPSNLLSLSRVARLAPNTVDHPRVAAFKAPMSNPADEEFNFVPGAASSAFQERVERERRLQTRARRARSICRWTVIGCGLGGIGGVFLGIQFNLEFLAGLGCFLFLPTLIAGVVLFFLGGIAPNTTRRDLNKRQQKLLDE